MTESGIILTDKKLKYVEGGKAGEAISSQQEARQWDSAQMMKALGDATLGMHEWTSGDLPMTGLGIVIGENPQARVPRYRYADRNLKEDFRQIIGWEEVDPMPQFGDVVLFYQNNATNWNGFWKLDADTNAANEFLLCDSSGQEIITVPRMADIVVSELSDVYFRFDALEELRMTA